MRQSPESKFESPHVLPILCYLPSKHAFTVMRAALNSFFAGLLFVTLVYVAQGAAICFKYTQAYAATRDGETLKAVLERFGPPSHIEPRYAVSGYDSGSRSVCGESCWLRLWYEKPFTLGVSPFAVDFNAQQKVIHKYEWHSP